MKKKEDERTCERDKSSSFECEGKEYSQSISPTGTDENEMRCYNKANVKDTNETFEGSARQAARTIHVCVYPDLSSSLHIAYPKRI